MVGTFDSARGDGKEISTMVAKGMVMFKSSKTCVSSESIFGLEIPNTRLRDRNFGWGLHFLNMELTVYVS